MNCERANPLLWPFAAAELADAPAAELAHHLEQCDACRRLLDGVRRLMASASALSQDEPARTLLLQTKEAVRLELERQGRVRVDFGPVMTPDDVAKYLKVDAALVYRHLDEIPHFEIDGEIRFLRERVDEWLEANRDCIRALPRAVS